MNVEIEALEDNWYRLPLTDQRVREVLLHGTGKRPWITVVLHDGVKFGLHYHKVIDLNLKMPVRAHADAVDDGRIETTLTSSDDEPMVIESFDVRLYEEEVEHMRDWVTSKLASEWVNGFGHIVHGVRLTLKGPRINTRPKTSGVTPQAK